MSFLNDGLGSFPTIGCLSGAEGRNSEMAEFRIRDKIVAAVNSEIARRVADLVYVTHDYGFNIYRRNIQTV